MTTVEINFARMIKTVELAVRRTAVFMGLGLNAAYDENFKKYDLGDHVYMRLVSCDITEKDITSFKQEFAIWITRSGLRELIEAFCIFLDNIYRMVIFIDSYLKRGSISEFHGLCRKFERKGLKGKLEHLRANFDVSPKRFDFLVSIASVRNCLAHRWGKVGTEDCLDGFPLTLKWMGFEFFLETTSGKKIEFDLPLKIPIHCEEESRLCMKLVDKNLVFKMGSLVDIPPVVLAEICYYVLHEAIDIAKGLEKWAVSQGIPLTQSQGGKGCGGVSESGLEA